MPGVALPARRLVVLARRPAAVACLVQHAEGDFPHLYPALLDMDAQQPLSLVLPPLLNRGQDLGMFIVGHSGAFGIVKIQPPNAVISRASCKARGSQINPFTHVPSLNSIVPSPSGGGMSASSEPSVSGGIS